MGFGGLPFTGAGAGAFGLGGAVQIHEIILNLEFTRFWFLRVRKIYSNIRLGLRKQVLTILQHTQTIIIITATNRTQHLLEHLQTKLMYHL